jgi:hypothetical protein
MKRRQRGIVRLPKLPGDALRLTAVAVAGFALGALAVAACACAERGRATNRPSVRPAHGAGEPEAPSSPRGL